MHRLLIMMYLIGGFIEIEVQRKAGSELIFISTQQVLSVELLLFSPFVFLNIFFVDFFSFSFYVICVSSDMFSVFNALKPIEFISNFYGSCQFKVYKATDFHIYIPWDCGMSCLLGRNVRFPLSFGVEGVPLCAFCCFSVYLVANQNGHWFIDSIAKSLTKFYQNKDWESFVVGNLLSARNNRTRRDCLTENRFRELLRYRNWYSQKSLFFRSHNLFFCFHFFSLLLSLFFSVPIYFIFSCI